LIETVPSLNHGHFFKSFAANKTRPNAHSCSLAVTLHFPVCIPRVQSCDLHHRIRIYDVAFVAFLFTLMFSYLQDLFDHAMICNELVLAFLLAANRSTFDLPAILYHVP
jgi:hypothetical protein